VCPLADEALILLLNQRGYQPIEFSSVLYQPIRHTPASQVDDVTIQVRLIESGEHELWAQTAASGWSDVAPDLTDYLRDLQKINAQRSGTRPFVAEKCGKIIAAGALCLADGVALLAGACTIPEWRKQGAQRALLEHRLRYGALQGCDIAMMAAAPGSASQRNAERQGFRIAYTRIKWRLNKRPASDPE
jgi:hypothetical protein